MFGLYEKASIPIKPHLFVILSLKISQSLYFACRSKDVMITMTDGVNIQGGVRVISSDIIRGYNDIFILSILEDGDSYGYEISKQITELSQDVYTIKETTLYSAFTRLKKNGSITDYPGDKTYGRARTYYAITEVGKQNLDSKREEWQLTKRIVENIIQGG